MVTIAEANQQDLIEIPRILHRAFAHFIEARNETREHFIAKKTKEYNEIFNDPAIHFVFAKSDDGRIAGFAEWWKRTGPETLKNRDPLRILLHEYQRELWEQHGDHWYLSEIAVDKECRKQGIGRHLVRWGMERAREDKQDAYWISDPDPLPFYLKNGAVLLDEKPMKMPWGDVYKIKMPCGGPPIEDAISPPMESE